MKRVFHSKFIIALSIFLLNINTNAVYSQEGEKSFSLIFSTGIEGSSEFLSKHATIVKQQGESSLSICLSPLLGDANVVAFDKGAFFLESAQNAGFDFIVPAASEFMFGVGEFKALSVRKSAPGFVSANLVDENTRIPLVDSYAIRTVAGKRILFVGISDKNTVKDSRDTNIASVAVITCREALDAIRRDILRENPDKVVVAGKMSRDDIFEAAYTHDFVDVFITTDSAEGFAGKEQRLMSAVIEEKPVYVVSGRGDRSDVLMVSERRGIESYELTEFTLDSIKPDEIVSAEFKTIIDELNRKEFIETSYATAGKETATILLNVFEDDVVFIERGALYYYPLVDSLTLMEVEKVVKPNIPLTSFRLKGSHLKSIIEQSSNEADPSLRVNSAGISEDLKIDGIPIQDDDNYLVLSTESLRSGESGYAQFLNGTDETPTEVDLLSAVESHLVAKDFLIREAERAKYWKLSLHLNVGSYFNKQDIDEDKNLYGQSVPKPLRDYNDQYFGNFMIQSWNNQFNFLKDRNQYDSTLHMKYGRSKSSTNASQTVYQEIADDLIFYNKYTYNHLAFAAKPYIDSTLSSEFYPGNGKHPIYGRLTAGLTRAFPGLVNTVVNVGFSADRNYLINENGMGLNSKITFDKSFPKNSVFTRNTMFHSETIVNYKPMARYNMEFYLQNRNNYSIQLWKKIDMTINVNTYAYRNTTLRKVAFGVFYDFSLNYAMDWDI